MQWADLEHSRRFFELFLRLIDDGTLDNTRGPIASNSTFWLMLYNLSEARPDWIAEALARWLLRRLAILRQTGGNTGPHQGHALFNHDQFGAKPIQDSATNAPETFARHVLPVILRIADEAVYDDEKPAPKRDVVFSLLIMPSDNEHPPMDQACRDAIVVAVDLLAEIKADSNDGILALFRRHATYMANFILIRAYTAGEKHLATNAVSELCDNPWPL